MHKHIGKIAIILAGLLLGSPLQAQARDLNAGFVMKEMNSKERVAYVAGVIEGLAYSRFLKDRPDETGVSCIYDWFYEDEDKNWAKMEHWFNRHPDKQVGVLLHVLIKKECGA